jgi:hypothetical protein
MQRAEVVERERRWAIPVALMTLGAVLLFVGSSVLVGTAVSSDGEADLLREVDAESGTYLVAGLARGLGSLLLLAPLLYLFRADEARADGLRGQLVGVICVTPVFMAAGGVISTLASLDAASDFAARGVSGSGERVDEIATDIIQEASLRNLASGLSIAGALGFAFSMVYTGLWAMRTGLLSRFWGSLGMALGAVSFFMVQFLPFVLLWFVYLGLLIAGWVPRGRPPAWERGVAVPWPSPGEQAAESMGGGDQPLEGSAREIDGEEDDPANPPRRRGERRKRKQRG